jgi:signal transduction histidine kinase
MEPETVIIIILVSLCVTLFFLYVAEKYRSRRAIAEILRIRRAKGGASDVSAGAAGGGADTDAGGELIKRAGQFIALATVDGGESEPGGEPALISVIARHIETPVGGIRNYGELLIGDTNNVYYRAKLYDSMDALTSFTESLKKLSRLEDGEIKLAIRSERVKGIIGDAILMAEPGAKAKGLVIYAEDMPDDIIAFCDRKWTKEALYNIMDNAVRFTDTGGRVNIVLSEDSGFARIDISDTGRGIPQEEIGEVFRRFYRAQGGADKGGAGIGLYLTRRIIEGGGGRVSASSGQIGATFSVFLPLAR